MSWDAHLSDDRGHCEFDVNYTHNCNKMANAALGELALKDAYRQSAARRGRTDVLERIDAGEQLGSGSWFWLLDGMTGLEGSVFLQGIINVLKREPEEFQAMNPDNGWGDYASFLQTLEQMRDAGLKPWPTEWSTSG